MKLFGGREEPPHESVRKVRMSFVDFAAGARAAVQFLEVNVHVAQVGLDPGCDGVLALVGIASPTTKDYMTFCDPSWVSDYGWNNVYSVIETLTNWDE